MEEKRDEDKINKKQTEVVWLARILKPTIGRNTVLKSLSSPILNYLFSALPNPSTDAIGCLQKILFEFILKGKPDKAKRDIMIDLPKH